MKISYLGPAATFTDLAVCSAFPKAEKKACMTIPECMDEVMEGKADLAVVPLENTLEGTVNLTIDYLTQEVDLKIIAELIAPIRQHLLMHPQNAERWKNIEKVMSHPHAIAQCYKFLHTYFEKVPSEEAASTAAAARYVSEHPEELTAAIGNSLSAEKYGLTIVKENIHDYDFNHTKFIVLSKEEQKLELLYESGVEKTTIMVTLPSDQAGALHQVLSALAWRKINLSKIESRPVKTGLGNYFFIIDINQRMDDILLPNAFAEMEALGCTVKVLGSYLSYQI